MFILSNQQECVKINLKNQPDYKQEQMNLKVCRMSNTATLKEGIKRWIKKNEFK